MNELTRSKIYHYELGHVACKTPTVKDMIEFLSQFPESMPILVTWEGVIRPIGDSAIFDFAYTDGEKESSIFFDVEFMNPYD